MTSRLETLVSRLNGANEKVAGGTENYVGLKIMISILSSFKRTTFIVSQDFMSLRQAVKVSLPQLSFSQIEGRGHLFRANISVRTCTHPFIFHSLFCSGFLFYSAWYFSNIPQHHFSFLLSCLPLFMDLHCMWCLAEQRICAFTLCAALWGFVLWHWNIGGGKDG